MKITYLLSTAILLNLSSAHAGKIELLRDAPPSQSHQHSVLGAVAVAGNAATPSYVPDHDIALSFVLPSVSLPPATTSAQLVLPEPENTAPIKQSDLKKG